LMRRARVAYCSVLSVSSRSTFEPDTHASITVRELPPSESCAAAVGRLRMHAGLLNPRSSSLSAFGPKSGSAPAEPRRAPRRHSGYECSSCVRDA
jgi:hypothetical protein